MNGNKKRCQVDGCIYVACFVRERLCYRHKYGKPPTGISNTTEKRCEMTCKCGADEWVGDPDPICDRFKESAAGFCANCWHDQGCHHEYKYRDGIGVAMFQIVQMYDNEWITDMRATGNHEYADLLESFMRDNDSITIVDVLHLRDFMAGCIMQRDNSHD